jgi:type IV secretory pathway VirB2 component (pilin)
MEDYLTILLRAQYLAAVIAVIAIPLMPFIPSPVWFRVAAILFWIVILFKAVRSARRIRALRRKRQMGSTDG